MKQNNGRSTESVSNVFYEGPAGQTGRRILYFIISNIGLVDYELLGYHIFRVLLDSQEMFDLVIDLTGFSSSTELPMPWMKKMLQMCPPGILSMVNVSCLVFGRSAR